MKPTHKTTRAARAFWVAEPGRGEIRPLELARLDDDALLIETLYSGISRGSESMVFRGAVPPSEFQRMRCPFQQGDFPSPVKYGYAAVGRVVAGPVKRRGEAVFVLHPHQDRFVVPAAAARPVPADVPLGRAVLAANMETALNAVWDGAPGAGLRVAVIGAGVVGLLVAYLLARTAGAESVLMDVDPARRPVADALGLSVQTEPLAQDSFDLLFHASGNPAGLVHALDAAAFEGRIIELSWYGTAPVCLPLGGGFHAKRLSIRSSQVGTVAASHREGWSRERRLDQALALLRDERLDQLISGETAFEDLPDVMAALADGSLSALCHRVRYS